MVTEPQWRIGHTGRMSSSEEGILKKARMALETTMDGAKGSPEGEG